MPPIKYASQTNGRPLMSNFRFAPRSFGQVAEYVQDMRWDSVEKLLHLRISETEGFEIMKWLSYLDDQYHQYQKSPFVDIDTNVAVLDFLDRNEHKIATMRFKNLKVEKHFCDLAKPDSESIGFDSDVFLEHEVTISYQSVETVVHADQRKHNLTSPKIAQMTRQADRMDSSESDDEWQTVKAPE